MAFAVSGGQLVTIQKPVMQAAYSLRITDDYTRDYAAIFREQPAVRTVVLFLARNIAQLGLPVFRRIGDNDRERLTEHALAKLLSRPNSFTTGFRFKRSLVADMAIYDCALWLKTRENNEPALMRIPPWMFKAGGDNWLRPEFFTIEGARGKVNIDAANFLYLHGYNPTDDRLGSSPLESLRRILAEEYSAGQMREQVLRNGARMAGYIKRPKDASDWSEAARNRFKTGWRSQYSGWSATEAGGTPILEDGMDFVPAGQSAVDLQYVEARKLTREEVASAFFIPPPMVGILDHATFGNIEEQHKMLYADTLGPWLEEIQQEIELQLMPEFLDIKGLYVEFNLAEKLKGSFEEQAKSIQTMVGAPVMTRNEGRSRLNLPRIDGGDALIVPLNVLEGGQASPTDSAPDGALSAFRIPAKARQAIAVGMKVRPAQSYTTKARQVLEKYFARQEAVVRSALGAKADAEWWNGDRWDEELSAELYALSLTVTTATARKQLEQLAFDADEYDVDRTLAYLEKVARSNATSINAVTKQQIEAALEEAEDALDQVAHVFDVAKNARSEQGGLTLVTALAGFATLEAVNQVRGSRKASKTWIVTSSRPRSSHAAMNGETVPIDQQFSNGAAWPGDSSALDVDEVAGCMCDLQITLD